MTQATTTAHREATRIVLRPIGSGLPLGFFALAVGTALAGTAALGVIPVSESQQVGQAFVTFAFPLELIATLVAFFARDTLSATAFGLFTASWLTVGISMMSAAPGSLSITSAVFQIGLGVCVAILAGLALMGKPLISILLGLSAVRIFTSGLHSLHGTPHWYTISGYAAMIVVLVALYAAIAFALEDAKQRPILPIFRRGAAEKAFRGYEQQLDRLEAEPGVRQQL